MRSPTEPVDLAISLINTNNRDLVHRCLASLPDACAGLLWRATVVDNASDDGSAELIRDRFSWAQLVINEHRLGFSANHNQILVPEIANATARYMLILNEDTVLEPRSLAELVRFADENPQAGAVGPTIYGTDGEVQPSYFSYPAVGPEIRALFRPGAAPRQPSLDGWLNGSCVLFRLDALRQVGPLDDRFFIFYEDTDICRRLLEAGWGVDVAHTSRILHLGHQTVTQPRMSTPMELQTVRSRYLYFAKHHGSARARLVALVGRAAYASRWIRVRLRARRTRDPSDEALARLLVTLARYRPAEPLPHETASRSGK